MRLTCHLLILFFLFFFGFPKGNETFGQNHKKPKTLNIVESYQLATANKYIFDLLNHKYTDSTITNFIKFDASFTKTQDYYEYYIYQEQPKIEKTVLILTIRINRFDKSISVYDSEKNKIIPIDTWIINHKEFIYICRE
jgi:hypothetical protein